MSVKTNLDTMRADYVLVRRWWKDAEGWTEAELAEADRGVRRVVERKDAELIACWAAWLATLAEDIRRFESTVRGAEARMRAAVAAERKRA
ncbi:MAG: hypothetical protein ROZ09_15145 [Thiobacillus sp.]|jgi:hypothetical protein|uniref:hypothetical protein n=1 Tax=Thiobacillus sp. TaxID=924 RepID=UPI002894C7E0|nr:hypothetical protein [Thiobacillus sp.]MDT3708156.1 hypothetical protein [Thiobacillus sp.]